MHGSLKGLACSTGRSHAAWAHDTRMGGRVDMDRWEGNGMGSCMIKVMYLQSLGLYS